MSTTDTKPFPETRLSPLRRRPTGLAILGLVPLILCAGCLLLYVATSPCSVAAQWYRLMGLVPTFPLPPDVMRLSARQADGKPIVGQAGTAADVYGELYITATVPDAIVAFYQGQGATCAQQGRGSVAYWSYDLTASPVGSGRVDILSQEAYRLKPDVQDVGITSYHLERAVPNEGTILRTWVIWCVDR